MLGEGRVDILGGEGSWKVRGCGKPKDRGKIGKVSKKGWGTGSVG